VKILHYVVYCESSDEIGDMVNPGSSSTTTTSRAQIPVIKPYSLYNELAFRIKQSLTCVRKDVPLVKMIMGFDYFPFAGGLQAASLESFF